jgi:uncharacterized protein YndB with AHSA1/START domain
MLRVPAVRFDRRVRGPLDRVWRHLTEPEKLEAWYGSESTIEPREGGIVRLMGGHVRGIVTQWQPQRRFAHSWNVFAPGESESQFPESYLLIELAPEEDGHVLLALTHLPILERFEKQNAMGWHTFLDIVEASVAGQGVAPRATYMESNAALYGVNLQNLER